jgi:hypothetical protein
MNHESGWFSAPCGRVGEHLPHLQIRPTSLFSIAYKGFSENSKWPGLRSQLFSKIDITKSILYKDLPFFPQQPVVYSNQEEGLLASAF